ncbi:MAG: excinuclease ABC subunit UvrA [Saprospiraceae bacterium]|nr:excinuclease ABC subunit UvrA [Saprospiraceae bacterium]
MDQTTTAPPSNNSFLKYNIHIKGARSNNLKNIDLVIPKNKLVVVTGLSGSGKSSLIIDTLYAEGQRRYVESLSSYARQFLDRMKKPEVDFIKGICPAIAIDQKVISSNARSTVGSLTEIYDYLRLLYARIGHTFSPISGEEVKKNSVTDVVDYIFALPDQSRVLLCIPVQKNHSRPLNQELDLLLQKGFTRLIYKGETTNIQDVLDNNKEITDAKVLTTNHSFDLKILIDRFVVSDDEENRKRVADSVLTAFSEGEGTCLVVPVGGEEKEFNNRFELDGITFLEPNHQLFNYNNPYGACPKCEGYGKILGIDPDKVIPDENLSVYEGAIACWRGEVSKEWLDRLIKSASRFDFPVHRPVKDLTPHQKDLLWTGNQFFWGLNDFFKEIEEKTYKIQNRVLLARFRGRTTCNECKGGRLRKEASYIKIDGRSISELINISIEDLYLWFAQLNLSEYDAAVSQRIILEINNRLKTMMDIGLSYLSLDRLSSTLSGGESQRINLTRTLGSNLTNAMYILDEPSVGLHPKDTSKLVKVLKNLRDLGNTVIVVEHEEEIIRNADFIVEIGPEAGIHGGHLVYAGPYSEFEQGVQTLTSDYISGKRFIPVPVNVRKFSNKIVLEGARQHNLKDINIMIPLNAITCVSGVSGSGKTTLIKSILYPALLSHLGEPIPSAPGKFSKLSGDLNRISSVEMVNQSPIGKSSRSNPVTYVKAYDAIRKLFADQPLSKLRGYDPKYFSFNVDAGRCDTCKGDGNITVEMQFLADVNLVCDECGGKRFKNDVLEVKYDGLSIHDVLELTVDEALVAFKKKKDIINKLQPLQDVGLGYIHLGQASNSLSGGEAQRVKLASFLTKEYASKNILFIFDEPTTGLHFHDVNKLMDAFNALVENGHSVLIIEHNLDVIKSSDWLIDLGPGAGKYGGSLTFQGEPRDAIKEKDSYTGQFLKEKF